MFPVYILESKATDGIMLKWNDKAGVGVFLGHSPVHAGSVSLVFNPRILHVLPQYHVAFNDNLSIVLYMCNSKKPPN